MTPAIGAQIAQLAQGEGRIRVSWGRCETSLHRTRIRRVAGAGIRLPKFFLFSMELAASRCVDAVGRGFPLETPQTYRLQAESARATPITRKPQHRAEPAGNGSDMAPASRLGRRQGCDPGASVLARPSRKSTAGSETFPRWEPLPPAFPSERGRAQCRALRGSCMTRTGVGGAGAPGVDSLLVRWSPRVGCVRRGRPAELDALAAEEIPCYARTASRRY